jgi:PiT family inorganic phosphate transporter
MGALTAWLVKTGVVGIVIAAVAGTAAVLYMYIHSKKSHVGHHNAVEVEEAGQAVRFRKKKAVAVGRGSNKPKGDLS